MGCTPVRLGVQGTGHEDCGGVIDADGADLPLSDLQAQPSPDPSAALVLTLALVLALALILALSLA